MYIEFLLYRKSIVKQNSPIGSRPSLCARQRWWWCWRSVPAMLVVVHCQWCRLIVRQTQNSRRTKWLLRSLAEKAKPRRAGGRDGRNGGGIVQRDREKEEEIGGEEDRESERITVVSEGGYCLHRANQNQPFQHTLPLGPFTDQHTRAVETYAQVAHTYTRVCARAIPSK